MNLISIADALSKPNERPGDYTGEDGLLYCGKCRTPKQMRGEGIFAGKMLAVSCACMIAEREQEDREEQRRRIEDLRDRCLPVKAMHTHTFDVAEDAKHILLAQSYVEKWDELREKNVGLLFWGNTGSGKSFTAHCIANALIDRGVFVRLYSAAELIRQMGDRDSHAETVRRLHAAPLLIVDDLGAERGTEYSRELLCAAIDERSEAGKPLIVTTNYTLTEMRQCQDREMQRIFDRLGALCVPVSVIGESRRREIGAEKMREVEKLLEL